MLAIEAKVGVAKIKGVDSVTDEVIAGVVDVEIKEDDVAEVIAMLEERGDDVEVVIGRRCEAEKLKLDII